MPKQTKGKRAKKDDTIEVLNYLMEEGYKPPRRRKKKMPMEEELGMAPTEEEELENPVTAPFPAQPV